MNLSECQDLIIDAHSHKHDTYKIFDNCIKTICCTAKYSDWKELENQRDARVYKCFGIHPWYVKDIRDIDSIKNELKKILVKKDKIKGMIGEIGLDNNCPDMDKQVKVFKAQLDTAVELNRNVFIHCVGAWNKMFDILKEKKDALQQIKIIFHGYKGDIDRTKKLLDYKNVYFSFNKCTNIIEMIPGDRILVETDYEDNEKKKILLKDKKYLQTLIEEMSKVNKSISFNKVYENTMDILEGYEKNND